MYSKQAVREHMVGARPDGTIWQRRASVSVNRAGENCIKFAPGSLNLPLALFHGHAYR